MLEPIVVQRCTLLQQRPWITVHRLFTWFGVKNALELSLYYKEYTFPISYFARQAYKILLYVFMFLANISAP
jgi:hypothetical protein